MPSAIWSMAPWSLPPIIIFIIMFSSMCSTSRMRVSVSETLWLNPEGELHRDSPVVAHDLDVARFDALLHAETDGEAFGLERTGLLGGLPLLDAVGDGRGEVVEAADDGVNLFGGT